MDNSVDNTDNKVDSWLAIEEAAPLLGVSVRTIRRRIKSCDIESEMRNGKWFVRIDNQTAVSTQMSQGSLTDQLQSEVQYLRQEVTELREELKRKDEQSEQAKERSDTIILQLTRQMEQSQRLLEYHAEPWYRRMFRKGRKEEID